MPRVVVAPLCLLLASGGRGLVVGRAPAVTSLCGTELMSTEGWTEYDEGAFTIRLPKAFGPPSRGGIDSEGGGWRSPYGTIDYDHGQYSFRVRRDDVARLPNARWCEATPIGAASLALYSERVTWPTGISAFWDRAPGPGDPSAALGVTFHGDVLGHRAIALTILSTVRLKPRPTRWPGTMLPEPATPEQLRERAAILRDRQQMFRTREFIAAVPGQQSVHASTIVELHDGLLTAWFGGSHEGAPDVGIWASRFDGSAWGAPVEIADGVQPDGTRQPTWNPVLFRTQDGVLHLWYKVGPAPARWWGMEKRSRDDGRTWSAAARLPDGLLGPIKNKPIFTPTGAIIAGSSTESPDEHPTWTVHFERSADTGRTWQVVSVPVTDTVGAIQPTIVQTTAGLVALVRTRSGRIYRTASTDDGRSWSPLAPIALPHPNSGIDAAAGQVGLPFHLVYNHTTDGRSPLNLASSFDGVRWKAVAALEQEPGEYSYPAIIETSDGLLHITYTWKRRRIRHVVLNPGALFESRPILEGKWPYP